MAGTHPEDDIRPEPVRGLPELLPPGERMMWQGAPSPWHLTAQALKARWVIGWCALLALWRGGAALADGTAAEAAQVVATYAVIGAAAVAVLYACGYVMAKSTVYTLTNRRVVMRIGAALTVTLQMPFSRIGSADLALGRGGTGTISFDPIGDGKLGTLALWPHCRPWAKRAQPAFRAIPDAAAVAELVGELATGGPARPLASAGSPDRGYAGAAVPAE